MYQRAEPVLRNPPAAAVLHQPRLPGAQLPQGLLAEHGVRHHHLAQVCLERPHRAGILPDQQPPLGHDGLRGWPALVLQPSMSLELHCNSSREQRAPAPARAHRPHPPLQPNSALEPKKEPNNVVPPEYCVIANYSQTYGRPEAWGWSDTNCLYNFIFICRIQGGRHAKAGLPVVPRWAGRLSGCPASRRARSCVAHRTAAAPIWRRWPLLPAPHRALRPAPLPPFPCLPRRARLPDQVQGRHHRLLLRAQHRAAQRHGRRGRLQLGALPRRPWSAPASALLRCRSARGSTSTTLERASPRARRAALPSHLLPPAPARRSAAAWSPGAPSRSSTRWSCST
jgi:hypothetical protein